MEFRHATLNLKKPIVFAVVGTGKEWKQTEVWNCYCSYNVCVGETEKLNCWCFSMNMWVALQLSEKVNEQITGYRLLDFSLKNEKSFYYHRTIYSGLCLITILANWWFCWSDHCRNPIPVLLVIILNCFVDRFAEHA